MQYKVTLYTNKSLGGITVEGNTVQCIRLTDERNAKGRRLQKIICTIAPHNMLCPFLWNRRFPN